MYETPKLIVKKIRKRKTLKNDSSTENSIILPKKRSNRQQKEKLE